MSDSGEWTPLRRVRSHEQVITAIEQRVLAGPLHVGDRLPPEPTWRRCLDTRIAIECAAVRAAAEGAETTSFGALATALVAMDEPTLATHRMHEYDTQFHVAIGLVSGN